jgi:hypothetical protein
MKIKFLFLPFSTIAPLFLCGCISTNTTPINQHYEKRSIIWELGDTGGKIALWGRPEGGRWREIWPAIPMSTFGKARIERGADLIFIGFDKSDASKRRVLITFNAGPVVDLSPEIFSAAVEARLIGENWKSGFDFVFDGLRQNEDQIFAVLTPAYGASFGGRLAIEVPIPPELLAKPPSQPNGMISGQGVMS